jgi:hypothetical protein
MRFRRGAIVAALAFLAAAAPAGASVIRSGGFRYVTKNYPSQSEALRTLSAPCPRGTHVWGGGHYNTGGFSEALPRHSYPYDGGDRGKSPDDGWKAQVSAQEGVIVSVYATCAARPPRYERGSVPAGGHLKTPGEVGCDKGFEAVSGGTQGYQHAIEAASGPDFGELGWFVSLDNYGEDRVVKSFAVCVKRTVVAPSDNDEVLPGTQEGHSVSCPAGLRIVGGGAGNPAPFRDIAMAASRPQGFGSTGADGWQVYLDNFDDSNTYLFSVWATCVEPLS